MNKQVCKYSIIRFQPYPETEEFANIGIVLYATASKRLEFKLLETKHYARITHFFEPLNKDVFVQTNKIIHAEIERIKKYLDETRTNVDLYAELIRSREDIVRFSDSRVLFCTDPATTVNELFEHYIHRSFVYEPSHEEKLKKQVRDLLTRYDLGQKYKDDLIGDPDKFAVRFPFVCKNAKKAVIKPIHFKYEEPTKIIDHGLTWLGRIQQLEKYQFIRPDEILFAYDAPDDSQRTLFAAFNEIKEQIIKEGIEMADIKGKDEIVKFAASVKF